MKKSKSAGMMAVNHAHSFPGMETRHMESFYGPELQLFSFFSPLSCFSVCVYHPQLGSQRERQSHGKGLTAQRVVWKSLQWGKHLKWVTAAWGSVAVPMSVAKPELIKEAGLLELHVTFKK